MKKNIFVLPFILTICLPVNAINNPDNMNFDFEDQTPIFQELLFGNKPTQTIITQSTQPLTHPTQVMNSTTEAHHVPTQNSDVVLDEANKLLDQLCEASIDNKSISQLMAEKENNNKLEELQSAADQARKNANNADKMSVGYACLTLASAGGIVAGYFLENNQFTSPFLIATCAFGGLSWYFDTQARSYNEEASQLSDQYDTLKTRINSENGK